MTDAPELGRVTDRRSPFKYSALTRVWFSDTDAQGVVYYGRYLPYFDHARTEYHRHLGGSRRAAASSSCAPPRWNTTRRRASTTSSRLSSAYRAIGRTSVTYECAACRLPDDALMVTAQQTLVLIDLETRRPTPVPDDLRAARARDSRAATSRGEHGDARSDRRACSPGRPTRTRCCAARWRRSSPSRRSSGPRSASSRATPWRWGRSRGLPTRRDGCAFRSHSRGRSSASCGSTASRDAQLLEQVAARIAPQVLIGWDTGGEAWEA